ncbi:S8 family serine peptidase [Alteromonas sp. MMG017]|uniref:S8 family serine peptidase n=1 Tax=Alteromonas sp. MMG017 TaxID=2822692 RepID=UPI001B3A3F9D|nr:S8 family serine peptidase [Alteromonas sp. MMG017]
MNNKVTLAVSAALMSMSMHSAAELSSATESFSVTADQLKAVKATSINKYKNTKTVSTPKTLYTAEKGLENKDYIYFVHLSDDAVASYDGGVEGLEATNPQLKKEVSVTRSKSTASKRLDASLPEVKAYASYLEKKQAEVIAKAESAVGSLETIAEYKYALNAIAVKASPAEAEAIARLPGVKNVERDEMYQLDTDTGPILIGAPAVWDGTANESGVGRQGEGVVVAVLDTGINSDHPSFADVGGDGYDHTNPLGADVYLGECAVEAEVRCNDKLIGIYSYPSISDVYADATIFPQNGTIRFGEDYNGHGSHTASTAAGNVLVDVAEVTAEFDVNASDGVATGFTFGQISGVAPHSNIISYQVCQPGNTGDTYAGCTGAAMAAAVDDAVESGIVDVINFSISGGGYPWSGSLNAAWLNARNAGIFIAQSAGNSGPDPETTEKHAPWITVVAASTHGRSVEYDKEISFTGGATELGAIDGKSNSGAVTASIVYAGDYSNANDPDGDPAQCLQPFPEDTFAGEIVVCDRGEIARVAKASNVASGGAAGFVLANLADGATSVNNDAYIIPGIHVDATNGDMLRSWLAEGEGHTASITASQGILTVDDDAADIMADFSSRGPNTSISTLTPSVTAPGVSIYAAYSDEQYGQDSTGSAPADYAYLQGTSMSGPHVAGAAALVRHEKPSWTPDQVRSALMMTATTDVLKEDGVTAADWFDMGAGRIEVDLAVQSGLVMDETDANYASADPALGGEPRTLNLPSVTDDNCVGSCTWTRTVTATKDGSWSVDGMGISDGIEITVTPATFDLTAGQSQELTIEIDAFRAESDVWSFGQINLVSGSSPDLHLPVSIVASNGNLPDEIDFEVHRNQDSYLLEDVMAVEITDLQVTSYGLTKATKVEGMVAQDSDNNDYLDDLEDGLHITQIEVPEGTLRLVAATMDTTSPDLDLRILFDSNADGIPQEDEEVAIAATAATEEYVSVEMPEAGSYWVIVQNWAASSDEEGFEDSFVLAHAMVDNQPGEGLTIDAPSAIPQLTEFDVRFTWDLTDAVEGDIYIGAVSMGTDAENVDNLGVIPVDIVRAEDDVYVTAESEERVLPGEEATFYVNVLPNFTTEDRDYEISLTLPDNVTLVEGSLSHDGVATENTLSWSITQESLLGATPSYAITTNATDAFCANPDFGQGGGYIDLAGFGIGQDDTLDGDTVDGTYTLPAYFLGTMYDAVTVTDDGFVTVGNSLGTAPWINQGLPDVAEPNGVIAPLWRDQEFDVANGVGVSVASAGAAYTIIEWDNMRFYNLSEEYADIADYQIVFFNEPTEGQPNIVFSYDNVTQQLGSTLPVTIGYEDIDGAKGQAAYYTPYNQDFFDANFDTEIVSGTQICMYLDDVDSSPTQLAYTVMVNADDAGGAIQMMAMSEVTNIPGASSAVSETYEGLQVEGPPVVTIDGMTVATLEVVELMELNLPGLVEEPNGDAVDITWKQVEGPAAIIAGAGIEEAILVAPEVTEDTLIVLELTATDSNGNTTMATANVTIKDNLPPVINITAPLTVEEGESITVSATATDPEGDDVTFTINDISGSSLTTTAPNTNTTIAVQFEVVAFDGLNTTTETVTVSVTDKSGGSMGWLALLLVPVVYLRRRKMK